MSVKVENMEHNMAKLTFEVPFDEFEKAVEVVYNKQKGKISIPGFRKGKAPRKMIEKMYGAEVFYSDAIDEVLPEAYKKAMDESGLDIVSRPAINMEKEVVKGEALEFTAEVAVRPEIKLPKYEGVTVTKIDTTVTDEDVMEELKKEQQKNSREVVVDRPVENGDVIVFDFDGSVDGVPFEGGKAENYSLEIGSGQFIPGFEEQLVGAKAEEDINVNVTFPEDYHAEDLKGKAAVFACKIHEIKAKELPEIDDALADDAGFDSLDAYKADIKERLTKSKAEDAKNKQIDEAMEQIAEGCEVDIPEAMIETQVERNFENFANRLMYQGLSMEQYMQFSGMNEESMKEQMKPSTISQIKTSLAVDAIAKEQKIEATEDELNAELQKMADSYGLELDKIKEMMADQIEAIKEDIVAKKAMDYVYDNRKEKAASKKADKETKED